MEAVGCWWDLTKKDKGREEAVRLRCRREGLLNVSYLTCPVGLPQGEGNGKENIVVREESGNIDEMEWEGFNTCGHTLEIQGVKVRGWAVRKRVRWSPRTGAT